MSANNGKMTVHIAFKGLDAKDTVKDYAEKRVLKLNHLMHHLTNCHFVFLQEKTDYVAQLHVISGDFDARAEGRGANFPAAIDLATDKLVHQARKHKERETDHAGRGHHNNGGDHGGSGAA